MAVLMERGAGSVAYERMPQADGTRKWTVARAQDPTDPHAFSGYVERRAEQDPDLWIVELDVHNGKRFIDELDEC